MLYALVRWLASGDCAWFDRAMAVTRRQYALFYGAAGVFKLNAAFFDPTASCGSFFALQHLAALPRWTWSWAPTVARLAPLATVGLEVGVAVAMAARPTLGAALALVLHAAISATPPPNNISSFSAKCAARLLLFASPDAIRAVASILFDRPVVAVAALPAYAAAAQRVVLRRGRRTTPVGGVVPQDVATAVFAPVALLVAIALAKTTSASSSALLRPTQARDRWVGVQTVLVGLAAFYAFATIPLGLQDLGSPSMYANLKITGGSNHFLLPTSLVPRLYADDPRSVFYGGVVRVEDTNSTFIRHLYPGDHSSTITPTATLTHLAPAAGYLPATFYHPAKGRVLGPGAVPAHQQWVPFTLPAFELRRLIAEAAARRQPFSLTYARLPGTTGDETWRATAAAATVEAHLDAAGALVACTRVEASSDDDAKHPCTETELVALPPLPWLATKLVLYLPYPVQFRDPATQTPPPNIQCFGP